METVTREVVRREWYEDQHFMERDKSYRVKIAGNEPDSTHAFKEVHIGQIEVEKRVHFGRPNKFNHLVSKINHEAEEAVLYEDKISQAELDDLPLSFDHYDNITLR